jgi:hypothetical protein
LLCCTCCSSFYKEAGVPANNFVVVPVFQAEGLTVTTHDMVRPVSDVIVVRQTTLLRAPQATVTGMLA